MNWSQFFEPLARTFSDLTVRVLDYLPTVLAALGLLLVGWIMSRVLRALTIRGWGLIERRLSDRLRLTAAVQPGLG